MSQNGRSVLVTLDKERHLRFTINALSDLEEVLGMGLGEIFTAPGGLGIRTIRAALWSGLKHEDSALTVPRTGDLVQSYLESGGSFLVLGDAIRQALKLAGLAGPESAEVSEASAPFVSVTGSTAPNP